MINLKLLTKEQSLIHAGGYDELLSISEDPKTPYSYLKPVPAIFHFFTQLQPLNNFENC